MEITKILIDTKKPRADTLAIMCLLGFALTLFFILPMHELGHYIFAKSVGVDGSLSLDWGGFTGRFEICGSMSALQKGFVAFGGGGFHALVAFGLWLAMPLKRSWQLSIPFWFAIACFLSVGVYEVIKCC